jgi:serine/threonine-protein kinase RsbW
LINQFTIACDPAVLPEIRKFIGDVLSSHDLPEVESHKMVLAVDEICANLIIHANNCDPTHHLDISVEVFAGKKVVFTIKDKGRTFDFNNYREPSIDEIVSSRKKGGLGLMLVRRIMDDIEFTTEKNYNICRLVKNL